MTDAEKWKRKAAERKKNNNWIQCNGQVVIFYPPDIEVSMVKKRYSPKAIGFTETIIILLLDNDIQIMLPTDRCVIVDPSASGLVYPEDKPLYNGVLVNEDEHIQTILYDAYANNWIEAPILTNKTKENDDE